VLHLQPLLAIRLAILLAILLTISFANEIHTSGRSESSKYKFDHLGKSEHIMTAVVYECRDLMFITHPSTEIIGSKVSILLDHLQLSGLSLVLKKQQFALGHIVHGCDTNLL
jgi:hypothetical protein